MVLFEDKDLVIRTRVLEDTEFGVIQEVVFIGIHDHLSRALMQGYDLIKDDFLKKNAAACLFDFTGYVYDYGNEMFGLFMVILVARGGPPFPPTAIVARGRTAKSLKSLIMVTNIQKICEIEFFEDPVEGLLFLRRALEKSKEPSTPPAAP